MAIQDTYAIWLHNSVILLCTAYPLVLKIGDFLVKDKAKRFKLKYVRCNGIRLLASQRDKGKKKVEKVKKGKKLKIWNFFAIFVPG